MFNVCYGDVFGKGVVAVGLYHRDGESQKSVGGEYGGTVTAGLFRVCLVVLYGGTSMVQEQRHIGNGREVRSGKERCFHGQYFCKNTLFF